MTLTFADIERWNPGDVREVFHAATSRAQAVQDAADGLATLPAFTTWGGEAAEAAKEAIGKTRADLNAHGREALAVANAARSAADEIERIRSDLATLKADAASLGMEIDPISGQVVAGPGFSGNPMELLLKQEQLQPRVDKLIGEANLVDAALANASTWRAALFRFLNRPARMDRISMTSLDLLPAMQLPPAQPTVAAPQSVSPQKAQRPRALIFRRMTP